MYSDHGQRAWQQLSELPLRPQISFSYAINCKSSGGNAHPASAPAENDSGLERWESYKENQIMRTQVLISSCSEQTQQS